MNGLIIIYIKLFHTCFQGFYTKTTIQHGFWSSEEHDFLNSLLEFVGIFCLVLLVKALIVTEKFVLRYIEKEFAWFSFFVQQAF